MEPEVTIMPLRLSVAPTMTIGELIAGSPPKCAPRAPHRLPRRPPGCRDLRLVGTGYPAVRPRANLKFFTPQLRFGDAAGTVGNIAMGPVDDLTVTGSPQPDGGFVLEVEANPARYSFDELVAHGERLLALLGRVSTDDAGALLGSLPVIAARRATEVIERNETDVPDLVAEAESTTLADLQSPPRLNTATAPRWCGTRRAHLCTAARRRRRSVGRARTCTASGGAVSSPSV